MREREAAKEGAAAAGALRPDSLAAALVVVQCEIEMGKGDRAGRGRKEGEFNSNFGQRAPSDGGIRTRGGKERLSPFKKTPPLPQPLPASRRPRVDTHKKQLICIEAERERGVEAEEKGRRME